MRSLISRARGGRPFSGPKHRVGRGVTIGLAISSLMATLGAAQKPDRDVHLVRTLPAAEWTETHAAGLGFSTRADSFVVLLANEDRAMDYSELGLMQPLGTLRRRVGMPFSIQDPLNATFDNYGHRLLAVIEDRLFFLRVDRNAFRETGAEAGYLSEPLALGDARGLTSDPATGDVYVLDGSGPRLLVLKPDIHADRVVPVESVDLSRTRLTDPLGIAFDPSTRHLYVLSPPQRRVFELTPEGIVVASRYVSHVSLARVTGMAFAPSTDSTDDSNVWNLYLNDGSELGAPSPTEDLTAGSRARFSRAAATTNLYELSTIAPTAMAPTATGTLVQVIDTSLLSPPSPDPAGIAYLTSTGNFLMSDSEVNETSLYQGVNVFELTFSGNVVDGFNTLAYSDEPTGVAFNPNNLHLFISDDTNPHVYEIDPGSDGTYATSDDTVTSFATAVFGSGDPEGITYDTWSDVLFIVDGVNSEVYRVDPGTNGLFDGVPPAGDDQVTSFDTASLGVSDPEGIAFDTDGGHLYIVGKPASQVAHVTTDGLLLRTIDISFANALKPAGLAYGPGSIDPLSMSLWVAARGVDNDTDPNENDGKVYEISIPGSVSPGNQPPSVFAGPDQSITFPEVAVLDGTVTDDGVPSTSSLTTTWSQSSGPANATFANPNAQDTTVSFPLPGVYILQLDADDGELLDADTITITVAGTGGESVVDVRIQKSSDDAEEGPVAVDLSSSDLEMVYDGGFNQTVGLRFSNVEILPGATIVNAYVQFQVDEVPSNPTTLLIEGQASDNPPTFTTAAANVSSRPRTSASVAWFPPPWPVGGAAGPDQRTPNLTPIVQELIDRPGWSSGNAMVLIVSGTGERVAESFNGDSQGAPLLHIVYRLSDPPIVSIESPNEGASFEQGTPVTFVAVATDPEDGDLSGVIVWESDRDGVLGTGTGFSRSDLSLGTHTISAAVSDSSGLVATDTALIAVTIGENDPPSVTIGSPANGRTFFVGETIVFTGTAADFEDGDLTSALTWTSSIDGLLGAGGVVTTNGLSVGSHTITASVQDGGGLSSQAQISIAVATGEPSVLVGAGDIADCLSNGDELTADLLDDIPGTVMAAGDTAYQDGTDLEFAQCYEPSWGRHKTRTVPALGNHEYHTPGAAGYFNYFGPAAGDPDKGYYSFDIGAWHVVILNSNCTEVGCQPNSAQGQWLAADLAAHRTTCTAAIWHHPLFSSGGGSSGVADFWQILNEAGADLVLTGHKHSYERFAPQNANGAADPTGMRQFVVGTGGVELGSLGITIAANSEVRDNTSFGVLKLTLWPNSYDWEFIPVAGASFSDSGSASCNGDVSPVVDITAPADGAVYGIGESVSFSATASDGMDGDLSSSLTWTSNVDGVVGTGATFTTTALSSGAHNITAFVTNGLGVLGQDTVKVTVNGNTPPTVSDIGNQTTSEDTPTGAIAFTVGDAETPAGSLVVSGSSSNPTLVPNGNVVFGGSGASRTVTVSPAANQNGSATITVTVSDGAATSSDTFVLTVTAVNDPPTVSDIGDQSTSENTPTGAIAFTVGDAETPAGSLSVSGSSSNPTLVPNGNIVFGGSGANRTVTVSPAANQNGNATITVTVSDGAATSSDTFVLTVTAVNDPPTVSDIGNQTTSENTPTGAIAFTVGDAETPAGSLVVSGSSSNPTLVPNGNIVFGGSGASRTVTVSPAANQNGSATI
ncbi:MAG TPA: Ig-like domain-containing protein, partial [Vicinamibacteria bacterium]|nr:Ig-like domain-containing protein [Vicinamibacteria bacterium]